MNTQAAYESAEELLIDLPVGYVICITAPIGERRWFFENRDSGIWQISPAEYCRAVGAN
jgi:hypothetical protein